MRFALLGAPGSGKGVQAKKICEKFSIPHVSSGDIFREEIAKKTPFGEQIQSYVTSGRLVPDQLVMQTMYARLERPDCVNGFLLDGFPRTVDQAEELEEYLSKKGMKLNRILYLKVDPEILVKRLSGRRYCEKCSKVYNIVTQPPQVEGVCDACGGKLVLRVDDEASTVRRRLNVYQDLTEPLVSFYRSRAILSDVDGAKNPEEVTGQIFSALEKNHAQR